MTMSSHKIKDFIKNKSLEQFYTRDMHILLDSYTVGSIQLKPDVYNQIIEIEENRGYRKAQFLKEQENAEKIKNSISKINNFHTIEEAIEYYEKIIQTKTYLINELLKKIKKLNDALNNR